VAQASSYYPLKLCQAVAKAMAYTWKRQEAPGSEQPQHALALSRRRLDLQQTPIGKRLEAVKQMMLRVHRASGHPSMTNLVSLLHGRAPG